IERGSYIIWYNLETNTCQTKFVPEFSFTYGQIPAVVFVSDAEVFVCGGMDSFETARKESFRINILSKDYSSEAKMNQARYSH
ncbi:MAG: hypothetical protein V2I33_20175, partial [Kangiellaceae bacterium]|nr:hypothetical protein [Kangiellaceae bacterium]